MAKKVKRNRTGLRKNGRINWNHPDNKRCVELVGWGIALKRIQRETGLSPGQIMYRAKANKMKISDFRNGVGHNAMIVLSEFRVVKKKKRA